MNAIFNRKPSWRHSAVQLPKCTGSGEREELQVSDERLFSVSVWRFHDGLIESDADSLHLFHI
jgi:hypothetical protein